MGQKVMAQDTSSKLDDILARGYLLVGTTGDFKPMSYYNTATGIYEGFDIEAAQILADSLGVKVEFVKSTWPTLMQDTLDGKFDIAMSGITRTFARQQKVDLSHGYIEFGKTALMRKADIKKYPNLEAINKKGVRVGVNPGGTNEKFVHQYLTNVEIPDMVASGKVDIMITDSMEAVRYTKDDSRLAAPLLNNLFTQNKFGIMMKRGDQDFLNYVNMWMEEMELRGEFKRMEAKYIH
jgi:cyclohexadienyl dehydratase